MRLGRRGLGITGIRVSDVALGTMTFAADVDVRAAGQRPPTPGASWSWCATSQESQRIFERYVDVLFLHAWDGLTLIEEIVTGFEELASSGKIRCAGISNSPAWMVSAACCLAPASLFGAVELSVQPA
jgi:aryl-alcohol dehydrogenase-like predicted oxidoreductase